MSDLLEKECIVISTKDALLHLCNKYHIPNKGIAVRFFEPHCGGDQHAYLISRDGIKHCDKDYPVGLTVFKTRESLELYLFEFALFNSRIVVHKSDYGTYLKTIRLLKKLRIKTIKDKTYFQEAYSFYVFCGIFKELTLFGEKCVASVTNGIQYNSKEFISSLKKYIKNKDEFRKMIRKCEI